MSEVAQVVVRSAPTSLVLLGVGGRVEAREGESIILTCRAEGGRPPPQLLWILPSFIPPPIPPPPGGEASIVIEVSRKLQDTSVSCSASHPALTSPLISSVTLEVQFVPEVSLFYRLPGGKEVEAAVLPLVEGDTVTIVCRPGGNPRFVTLFSFLVSMSL